MDAWHNFKLDLNTSYYQFIEYKLELMTTYEGLLDSNERKKFEIIMRTLKLHRQKRLIKLKKRENKHTLINKSDPIINSDSRFIKRIFIKRR